MDASTTGVHTLSTISEREILAGGVAEPGTGSTGDGDPPGWSKVNPGQGGTGPGQ